MTLTLDTRTPIIVLIADFNSAIFQIPWMAQHLFGRAEGEDIELTELVGQNGNKQIHLAFLDGVAINVAPSRTELWALNADGETLARVETVLLKMIEALPHTPVSAVGCNFIYTDQAPPPSLSALFETREGLEAEGILNSRQSGVQLQLDDQVLNFSRHLTATDAKFSFNYHRNQANPEAYKGFMPGLIQRSLEHSAGLLKSYYGYDEFEIAAFIELPSEGGDGVDVEVTT